jgi:hypothetical protein
MAKSEDSQAMDDRQLSSPHHQTTRSVLRIGGPILAVVGLIFLIVGLVDFFGAFGGGGPPQRFWCFFVGMPLLFVGLVMTQFGYLGAFYRYVATEATPVATDAFNETADGIQPGVRKIARSIAEGLNEGQMPPK